jgi:hypothetical protein
VLHLSRVAAVLVVTATLGGAWPGNVTIRVVWDFPADVPHADCTNRAYAANNPDKCGISGPFLLGGGAPSGGGLLGTIGRVLHDLTGL